MISQCARTARAARSGAVFARVSGPFHGAFHGRALSGGARTALAGWASPLNIVAGAYIGGLLVCGGSLYFLYQDVQARQHVPLELSWQSQLAAVRAISKDDVMRSPRHAVKHYRRLLVELAAAEAPGETRAETGFRETLADGSRNYAVPLLPADVLVHRKSAAFANFYIDMVLRYAKALLAKGQLDVSVALLKQIVDDDSLFYAVGDAERMAQCCRVLSRVSPDKDDAARYLHRAVDMLRRTFANVKLAPGAPGAAPSTLQDGSVLTDELLRCLNGLAAVHARRAAALPARRRDEALARALNIYLANLKAVAAAAAHPHAQAAYPLLDCSAAALAMEQAEIKAHVSEVLWARGCRASAVAWAEDVVDDIYFDHASTARAAPILLSVLDNLVHMYSRLRDPAGVARCAELRSGLRVFDRDHQSWYDSTVERFTKIIYYKGPLGVLEKALKERFGAPQPLPEIEAYEDEDEE